MPTLTLDSWIVDSRVRHHRLRDHFGSDDSMAVALSQRIGPYEAQTPIHHVLLDMVNRIGRIESGVIQRSSITIDAWITTNRLAIDAIIRASRSGSIVMDAEIFVGGRLAMDAWIQPTATLTMDAVIVWGDA